MAEFLLWHVFSCPFHFHFLQHFHLWQSNSIHCQMQKNGFLIVSVESEIHSWFVQQIIHIKSFLAHQLEKWLFEHHELFSCGLKSFFQSHSFAQRRCFSRVCLHCWHEICFQQFVKFLFVVMNWPLPFKPRGEIPTEASSLAFQENSHQRKLENLQVILLVNLILKRWMQMTWSMCHLPYWQMFH